jgi:hypothetical protein
MHNQFQLGKIKRKAFNGYSFRIEYLQIVKYMDNANNIFINTDLHVAAKDLLEKIDEERYEAITCAIVGTRTAIGQRQNKKYIF